MKRCLKCGEEKRLDEFPMDRRRKDGRHPYCRVCKAADQRRRNKVESEARRRLQKTCRKCGKSEPEVEFPSRSSHHCWSCHEDAARRRVPRGLADNERHNRASWIRRNRRKAELVERMGGKCADCGIEMGEEWPSACFDFHHLEGKEADLARLIHAWKSMYGRVLEELEKCVMLCANCHRKRHFTEKGKSLKCLRN